MNCWVALSLWCLVMKRYLNGAGFSLSRISFFIREGFLAIIATLPKPCEIWPEWFGSWFTWFYGWEIGSLDLFGLGWVGLGWFYWVGCNYYRIIEVEALVCT